MGLDEGSSIRGSGENSVVSGTAATDGTQPSRDSVLKRVCATAGTAQERAHYPNWYLNEMLLLEWISRKKLKY